MKTNIQELVKKFLKEDLEYAHVDDATKDNYIIGENEISSIVERARIGRLTEFENSLHFKDGKLNKPNNYQKIPGNTINKGSNPIVDFGVGKIGTVNIEGYEFQNALYLQGGYNAAEQRKGYGTEGIRFLFNKLPKIQNILLGCYKTACPFWIKIGGVPFATKQLDNGLFTYIVVTRDAFKNKVGL